MLLPNRSDTNWRAHNKRKVQQWFQRKQQHELLAHVLLLATSAGQQGCMSSKLSPVGIQVTIQQDPLGVVIRLVGQLTHVVGQQAVLPLTCRHVDVPIQLLSADTLGIQIPDCHLHVFDKMSTLHQVASAQGTLSLVGRVGQFFSAQPCHQVSLILHGCSN